MGNLNPIFPQNVSKWFNKLFISEKELYLIKEHFGSSQLMMPC